MQFLKGYIHHENTKSGKHEIKQRVSIIANFGMMELNKLSKRNVFRGFDLS